jgi:hypothetical protein
MSTNIKLKRSAVSGRIPGTGDLELGELAINTFDGKLYLKKDDGTQSIVDVSSGLTASEILALLQTVDGSGSGLDADLLDGQQGSYYLDWTNTTNKPDPVITLTGAVTGSGTMTDLGSVSITTTATSDPTLTLAGDATGSATFTNLGNATLTVAIVDDSHNHIIGNVDGLQTALDAKLPLAGGTMTGDLLFGDGNKAIFGAGSDLQIYHSGLHSYINEGGTGNLRILAENFTVRNPADNESMIIATPDSGVTLFHDGGAKLATTSTGVDVTGTVTATAFAGPLTGAVTGNASTATTLQTARAIQVSGAVTGTANFDGSAAINIVTTATSDPVITLTGAVTGSGTMTNLGSVSIATTATADPTLTLAGDATGSATFTNLGNATLTVTVADDSHNHIIGNVDGLQTALDAKLPLAGGTMTGDLLFGDNDKAIFGAGSDLLIYHDSTLGTSRIQDVGTGSLYIQGDGGVVITNSTGTSTSATFASTGATSLSYNGTTKFATTGTGVDVTGTVTATAFAGPLTGAVTGNASTATTLQTARAIQVSGAVTGTANFDGSAAINIVTTATSDPTLTLAGDATGSATFTNLGNATLTVTVADDSHNHIISNVDGLQTALDAKLPLAGGTMSGDLKIEKANASITLNDNSGSPADQGIRIRAESIDTNLPGSEGIGIIFEQSPTSGSPDTTPAVITTGEFYAQSSQQVFHDAYHPNADKWTTARTITLGGVLSGSTSIDGSGNVTLTAAHTSDPVITLTGAVTGTGTMTNLGSVSITTTATSDPTLTLAGDATGSATFTNLGNATLTVAVADDSHNHSSSSGNFTVNGILTSTANTTVGGSLQVDGDLTVSGNTVTINVTDLAVEDNMIYLNSGSVVTNPDLGFAGNYNDGTYAHAGFFRDATDGYFKPFKGYTLEPDASAFIDTSHASFALADIQAANFRGALVGNASTATTLQTARTIALSGAATGTATSFNGSANITIPVTALNASNLSSGTVPDARISGSYTGMTNLTGTGNVDFAKFLGNAADLVTAPSYSWTGDTNTGMWRPGADQIGFATAGVSRLNITTAAITSTLPISASTFTGALSGNATTATTLQTARTIALSGDVTGSASFNGSANITITAAVANDSHNHSSSSGGFTVGGNLVVSGGVVTSAGVSTRDKYRVWSSGLYTIGMQSGFTFGGLVNEYAMTFQMNDSSTRGFWWGDDAHTNAQGAMSLTTNGKLSVAHSIRLGYGESDTTVPGASYVLDVNGSFAATTKSFVIDHPTKEGMKLRHGSLEGPEDGVYVRGRLKDDNVIELPDYWTGLVHEDSITVNLTAIGRGQDLWVEDIVDNTVIVGGENVNCFYTVFATRKDVEQFDVEY